MVRMKDVVAVVALVALSPHVPQSVSRIPECDSAINRCFFHIVCRPSTHHLLHLVLNRGKQPKAAKREGELAGLQFLENGLSVSSLAPPTGIFRGNLDSKQF